MSSKSKAKAIVNLWLSDESRWWSWDETLEDLIHGFDMIPRRLLSGILKSYRDQYPQILAILDERGKFLLRDGMGRKARFKIATTAIEDKPEVDKRLGQLQKRENGISGRIDKRVENLKESKILPPDFRRKEPQLDKDNHKEISA
jgi:hypothetical protein